MNNSTSLNTNFNQFNSGSKKTSATKKSTNFIEALREQGKAATIGVVQNAFDQLTSNPRHNDQNQENKSSNKSGDFDFAEFLQIREKRIRQQERALINQQHNSEKVLFNRQNEQTKQAIEEIKIQIKQIIVTAQDTSVELIEAEKTVMSNVVEAGTYQLNFLQRIRRLVEIAKIRISEASHWLEVFNTRTKSRGYYWAQVKKSGTRYMLSNERTLATQTG